jgi:G:T-mismatch repair DNA endonuclease (very short patch repair protein)
MRKGETKYDRNLLIPCSCGCGELIHKFDKGGRERRFVIGHSRKGIIFGISPTKFCFIKEKEDEVIKLYNKTKNSVKVAEIMKISYENVLEILKINNIKIIRNKSLYLPKEEIFNIYKEGKMNQKQLAEKFNCSNYIMCKLLAEIKIIKEKKIFDKDEMIECACGCKKLRKRFDERGIERIYIVGHAGILSRFDFKNEEEENEIIRLYTKEKMGMIPIGKKFGVSHVKIKSFLKSKGIKLRGKDRCEIYEYKEQIKEMYLNKISASEIARRFKCKSENPIIKILKEEGIKINRITNTGKKFSIEEYPNMGVRGFRDKLILPFRDSLIEIKIQNFLKQLGIEFFTHQYVSEIKHAYQCDIFIPIQEGIKQKTVIECDGDYFHANPNKYKKDDKIFRKGMTAEQVWEKDNTRTKELIEAGYRIIRLWESDIKVMELNNFMERLNENK